MSLLVETGIANLSPLVATRMNTKLKSAFFSPLPRFVLSRARVATSGDRPKNDIEVGLRDVPVIATVRHVGGPGDQTATPLRQAGTSKHDHGGYVAMGERR
jgi:hypothetical protein